MEIDCGIDANPDRQGKSPLPDLLAIHSLRLQRLLASDRHQQLLVGIGSAASLEVE
jgi:hypothetical protein